MNTVAYRDNLARYEYAPAYDPTIIGPGVRRTTPAKRTAKPAVRVKKKAKAKRLRVSAFLMAATLVACAFLVLYRAANITAMTNEVTQKEKQLSDLTAANQQTRLALDKSLDLKKVEEAAAAMGMRQPEKSQTVYVNLERSDYVERTSGEGSILSRIGDFFQGLLSYLD